MVHSVVSICYTQVLLLQMQHGIIYRVEKFTGCKEFNYFGRECAGNIWANVIRLVYCAGCVGVYEVVAWFQSPGYIQFYQVTEPVAATD